MGENVPLHEDVMDLQNPVNPDGLRIAKSLPATLCEAVINDDKPTTLDLLTNFFSKKDTWDKEAFISFFAQNPRTVSLDKWKDVLARETKFSVRVHLLTMLQCYPAHYDRQCSAWDVFFKGITDPLNNPRGSRISSVKFDAALLWRHPQLATHVIQKLTEVGAQSGDFQFLADAVNTIPPELLQNDKYILRAGYGLTLRQLNSTSFISFANVPDELQKRMREVAVKWTESLDHLHEEEQLRNTECNDIRRLTLTVAIQTTFSQYMAATPENRSLEQDLLFLTTIKKTGVVTLREMSEGLLLRWSKTQLKTVFFNQIRFLCSFELLTFIPESVFEKLLPKTAMGGAAKQWLEDTKSIEKAVGPTEDRLLKVFAKLLAERVAGNDPAIPTDIIEHGTDIQQVFAKHFLTFSFSKLMVAECLSCPAKVVELLESENLDRENLFVQCVVQWVSGAIKCEEKPQQFSAESFTLGQLHIALTKRERVEKLNSSGLEIVPLQKCEYIVNELASLERLMHVQVLSCYAPSLLNELSDHIKIEPEWLDGPLEEKWADVKADRLLRCNNNLSAFLDEIPREVQNLLSCMTSSEAREKSVLFDTYMREFYRGVRPTDSKMNVAKRLKDGLTDTQGRIESLLEKIEKRELLSSDMTNVFLLLKNGEWTIEKELSTLSTTGIARNLSEEKCEAILRNARRAQENLLVLREIRRLLVVDTGSVSMLKEYNFVCYEKSSSKTSALAKIQEKIRTIKSIESMTLGVLEEYVGFIMDFFPEDVSRTDAGRTFNVLSNLRSYRNVWNFFVQNPSYVGDGQCTFSFVEQIEVFLRKLRQQKVQILETFRSVSGFIVVLLRGSQVEDFSKLVPWMMKYPAFQSQIRREEKEWTSFLESLAGVNNEMAVVDDVFKEKEDPFDVVVSQYEFASGGYCFYYDLDSGEMSVAFKKKDTVEELSATDTLEFQLQLGFAVRDDISRFKESGGDVKTFLQELESLSGMVVQVKELHSSGHPKFSDSKIVVRWGKKPPEPKKNFEVVAWDDMKKLEKHQKDWLGKLSKSIENNPWFSLISTPLAHQLALELEKNNVARAYAIVCQLFREEQKEHGVLRKKVQEACTKSRGVNGDWLDALTMAMSSLQDLMPTPSAAMGQKGKEGACLLYSCGSESEEWYALEQIYKGRDMHAFEFLWCDAATDPACIDSLLRRATRFPQYHFTVVRSDLLGYSHQQQLLHFLSHDSSVSNISFVEFNESILRSSHRVKVIVQHSAEIGPLKCEVGCFTGPAGCGKTYQLHKAMREKPNSSHCLIVVSEHFRLSDAVEAVMRAVAEGEESGHLVIGLRFSVGCYLPKEKEKWMHLFRLVNTFLFGILKMKCVEDTVTGKCVCIPSGLETSLLVELPPNQFFGESNEHSKELLDYFPLLKKTPKDKIHNCRDFPFDLNTDAEEVAKYLKAYEDNTIDEKFDDSHRENIDILFLLDISGSMRKNGRLAICKENILKLVENLKETDRAGLSTFNEQVSDIWDMNQCSPGNVKELKRRLDGVEYSGNTHLYKAALHCCSSLVRCRGQNTPTRQFLVILTDGAPDGPDYDTCFSFFRSEYGGRDVGVITITIEVTDGFQRSIRHTFCRDETRDRLIATSDAVGRIDEAFGIVGEQLSVNQKIQNNAATMTPDDVPRLIWKYMNPKQHRDWSRVHMSLWIQYMRRRCTILASSASFDKNTDKPKFGSTTMEMMILEAEHAVGKNHVQWIDRAHQHMVYRREIIQNDSGEQVEDYKWSIITMNQEKDPEWDRKKKLLGTLKMCVPDTEDLKNSRVLESYLAYAIDAELVNPKSEVSMSGFPFDFPLGSLPALREHRFVLTLDYLMKMLLINERIKCRAPCIVMGETGVSKTKVTEMLFKLKNSSATESKDNELSRILNKDSAEPLDPEAVMQQLCGWLRIPIMKLRGPDSIHSRCTKSDEICKKLGEGLVRIFQEDPSLDPLNPQAPLPLECLENPINAEHICRIIEWFLNPERDSVQRYDDRKNWMFVVVNMHSAMTAEEIKNIVGAAADRVRRLHEVGSKKGFMLHEKAEICIFFDEFNSSSCMGLLKEIIQDRTLCGVPLPQNLVPIAACNPYRTRRQVHDTERMNEQGSDWISGHYNVRPLPQALDDLTWDYGSLLPPQEKEFIEKRLSYEELEKCLDRKQQRQIADFVCEAHCLTRNLAKEHMSELYHGIQGTGEVEERAKSAVSLRDILRFFRMFHYFRKGAKDAVRQALFGAQMSETDLVQRSAILAVAVVYYLRLSIDAVQARNFRERFTSEMKKKFKFDVEEAVAGCIRMVMKDTHLDKGVVSTRSLQENLTTILLSVASKTPLIIKGPPGTSKTLAVQILCENAHGEFSLNPLYKSLPAMNSVHYQCSRQSSSKEIKEIFESAIRSQKSSDDNGSGETIYFVFMDEAGLPEEERESLKVLHYYLESNTRRTTEIGFVAITNQLLDAANSNRCNMLSRAKYNGNELKILSEGCLSLDERAKLVDTDIVLNCEDERAKTLKFDEVINRLCERFEQFVAFTQQKSSIGSSKATQLPLPDGSADFFSLRDFMHLFKLLGRMWRSLHGERKLLRIDHLVEAFQRNFNGLEQSDVRQLCRYFLSDFKDTNVHLITLFNPVQLLVNALKEGSEKDGSPVSRYVLVTDMTSSDGVLTELHRKFELRPVRIGLFRQTASQEEMRALGDICWSAAQGHHIGLSNTQSIHESLYDLFNQHYKLVKQGGGKRVLRTNIAVGSLSVTCDVATSFRCIVFMSEAELNRAPAAFLDRLEKYRINMSDILHHYLATRRKDSLWQLLTPIVRPLHDALNELLNSVGWDSFYGVEELQTIESGILALLRRWESVEEVAKSIKRRLKNLKVLSEAAVRESESGKFLLSSPGVPELSEWLIPQDKESNTVALSVLLEVGQLEMIDALFDVAIPEKVLPRLPEWLVDVFLVERHFTLFPMDGPTNGYPGMKELVFTRAISNSWKEQLLAGKVGKFKALDYSSAGSETEFKAKLEALWECGSDVALYIDLPHCGFAQINFARHCVDEMCSKENRSDKRILFVVEISTADTLSQYSYSTTLNTDWRVRFLDAVGYENLLPWLQMAYQGVRQSDSTEQKTSTTAHDVEQIRETAISNCPAMLVGVMERVPHQGVRGGATGAKYLLPQDVKSVLTTTVTAQKAGKTATTCADVIAEKYVSLWKDKEDQRGGGVSAQIRDVVQSQVDSPLTGCLTHTIRSELSDLLTRLVSLTLRELLPVLDEPGAASTKSETATAVRTVLEVFQAVPVAQMTELRKPLVHERVQMLYKNGFPFYKRLKKTIPQALIKVYDFLEEEESVDVEEQWEEVVEGARNHVEELTDEISKTAVLKLWSLEEKNPLFKLYVENFVADTFHSYSENTRAYATEWLLSHVRKMKQPLVMLHVVYESKAHAFAELVGIVETMYASFSTLAKEKLESNESIVDFLYKELEQRLQSKAARGNNNELTSCVEIIFRAMKCSALKACGKDSMAKLQVMARFASACATEFIMRNDKTLTTLSVTPLLTKVFQHLSSDRQDRPAAELDALFTIFSKHYPKSITSPLIFMIHLCGAEKILAQWAYAKWWSPSCGANFNEALPSLMSVEVRGVLTHKSLENFYSLSTVLELLSSTTALEEVRRDYSTMPEGEELLLSQKAGVSAFSLFRVLQNWIPVWCRSSASSSDTLLWTSREMHSVNGSTNIAPLYKQCALTALKKRFIEALADRCAAGEKTSITDYDVVEQCSRLFRTSDWVGPLASDLLAREVRAESIQEQCKVLPCLTELLTGAKQELRKTTTKAVPETPRLGFDEAKLPYSREMKAIEVMRHMWFLPLLWEVYSWVLDKSHNGQEDLLAIADPENKSRWTLLRAAVCTAKESGLGSLPELPETVKPRELLDLRSANGSVTQGRLHAILRAMQSEYDMHVMKIQWWDTKTTAPVAHSLVDMQDLLGTNDTLLSAVREMINGEDPVKAVAAKNLMLRYRSYFELCSPVSATLALSSVTVDGLSGNTNTKSGSNSDPLVSSALHWLIHRCRIAFPPGLDMEAVLDVDAAKIMPAYGVGKGATARLLHNLFHSLHRQDLQFLRLILLRAAGQDHNLHGDLNRVIEEWVDKGYSASKWLSDVIGLEMDACLMILALPISDANKICAFVDEQIRSQAYVFAEKAVELKEALPPNVERQLKKALHTASTVQLSSFSRFLAEQENKIERNARKTQVDHELTAVLASSLQSREMLYRQYPVLHTIEDIVDEQTHEKFHWMTSHYVALRQQILSAIRENDGRRKRKLYQSTWALQLEWDDTKIASPVEMGQDNGKHCWDFLLSSPTDEGSHQNSRGRSYKGVRAQLSEKMKHFKGTNKDVLAISDLLAQLPPQDEAAITKRAEERVNEHWRKMKEHEETIKAFTGEHSASGVKVNEVNSKNLGDAVRFVRQAHGDIISVPESEKRMYDTAEKWYNSLLSSMVIAPNVEPISDRDMDPLFSIY